MFGRERLNYCLCLVAVVLSARIWLDHSEEWGAPRLGEHRIMHLPLEALDNNLLDVHLDETGCTDDLSEVNQRSQVQDWSSSFVLRLKTASQQPSVERVQISRQGC